MTKNSYKVFLVLIIIAVVIGPICNVKNRRAPGPIHDNGSKIESRVDSIMKSIEARDTIIVPRDTVIYRTKKVKEIVFQYVNTKDTIVKAALCDSLVIRCDSIASQYSRNDSLFRKQVDDYKNVIALKDTIISNQDNAISKLNRRAKFVAAASATAAAVLTIILLK